MLDFQAARWTIDGEVPAQAGNNHPTIIPTGVFKTADGYINIASSGEQIWQRLCHALGAPSLIDDPRYANGTERSKHRDALNAEIKTYTVKKRSAEWIDILNEAGVPCGPIYKMDEMWGDPHVRHLDMTKEVTGTDVGSLKVVRNAVNLSEARDIPYRASPELGEHTEEILGEFGFTEDEIASMKDNGGV